MTGGLEEHRKAANALRPFFTEMLAKRGLKLLAINAWPTQQLFSVQPIKTVGDWKGKKIRVYGADSANTARALGAAPVSLGFGEVYTALEKKTVDGAITSATNAEPMKFFEVSKFINYWNIAGAGSEWFVANQKAFDALPKDLQQVVMDALRETRLEDKEWEDATAWDARAKKRCAELGMTVVEPGTAEIEKARKLARGGWDTWLTRTGADGKRGMELALKALGR
jgi:TRAP-type C4-dicarboxylate transport system substrate-binding protein